MSLILAQLLKLCLRSNLMALALISIRIKTKFPNSHLISLSSETNPKPNQQNLISTNSPLSNKLKRSLQLKVY